MNVLIMMSPRSHLVCHHVHTIKIIDKDIIDKDKIQTRTIHKPIINNKTKKKNKDNSNTLI